MLHHVGHIATRTFQVPIRSRNALDRDGRRDRNCSERHVLQPPDPVGRAAKSRHRGFGADSRPPGRSGGCRLRSPGTYTGPEKHVRRRSGQGAAAWSGSERTAKLSPDVSGSEARHHPGVAHSDAGVLPVSADREVRRRRSAAGGPYMANRADARVLPGHTAPVDPAPPESRAGRHGAEGDRPEGHRTVLTSRSSR